MAQCVYAVAPAVTCNPATDPSSVTGTFSARASFKATGKTMENDMCPDLEVEESDFILTKAGTDGFTVAIDHFVKNEVTGLLPAQCKLNKAAGSSAVARRVPLGPFIMIITQLAVVLATAYVL